MAVNSTYNNLQGKPVDNSSDLRRNPNDFQMSTQFSESQNITNLLLPNSQGASANPLLSYQNNSFSGLYGSPGFNGSLTGYENNLQWLTDSRLQSQHSQLASSMIPDKNINTTVHSLTPTTSHSCCVNRFSVLDSLGVSSPIPPDPGKSACDIQQFQNSKTSLSMSVIDPIQSWLNLQIPAQISNNQQYCKYGERSIPQNYNISSSLSSQVSLPTIDQTDSKLNEMCIQNQDNCFENINTINSKNIVSDINIGTGKFSDKHNSFESGNKLMSHDNSSVSKQQNASYQSNIASKEWKTSFQSMQNYISSPNLFNTGNDHQDNYLFTQYSMPPAKLYYSPSDTFSSFANKSSTCITPDKTATHYNESNSSSVNNTNPFIEHAKPLYNNQVQCSTSNNRIQKQLVKEGDNVQQTRTNAQISINLTDRTPYNNNSFSDCCQISKSQVSGAHISRVENNNFGHIDKTKEENKSSKVPVSQTSTISVKSDKATLNVKKGFRISEAESSESDESNIIVEESDIGEIESEISIEEIKKSYKSGGTSVGEVLLRCLICNITTSSQTPANQFIHMNDSFPLTTSYQTPVHKKLEQIIPTKLQHYLKVHNSFMCRRCLNLIETVEVLEVKLKTAKQTISESFSNTVQQLIPDVEELLRSDTEINVQVEHLFQSDDKIAKSHLNKQKENVSKPLLESEQNPKPADKNFTEEETTLTCDADEDENTFKCSYCGKILSSQINFNLHLQQHTKEFNYYCERCGKGFPLKSSLERHLNWHNGEGEEIQVLCEICGQVFSRKDIFKSHCVKDHSGKFRFECKECGKGFSRKISLEIHSHKHSGVRPFICEFCGHTFTTEANLKSHIRICTKDLPFKCSICPKNFALEVELVNHNLQHNGVNKLSCSVCNKGFDKPSNLKYHMRTHSSEKSFKCNRCEKAFKTVWNLNYHSKVVHEEEKLFVCSICGRNFGKKVLLMDHMNSHTNEQPYKCFQCDKSFTHQTTFFSHLRIHTGKVKMKTCPECGKSIKTRMSVHMRTHSKEKPYQCTFCPLAFSVNSSLKKHIIAKHGKT